ncbi:signal transduction histidine-protein kinase/phosphatase UhpB [Celerinatantimonas sp. YJH-8]|uniref:signal transduction histidine-protein kinase/phosphatase UhpB n=1 Tax=Celerinatantimonas sp. YJH-8 TaxID=3228714 RepID=UPI0038C9A46E
MIDSIHMRHYWMITLCSIFIFACSWFCLWAIAYYFLHDPVMAMLLFPFALRLGIIIHSPKAYWLPLYLIEWSIIAYLGLILPIAHWPLILLLSLLSLPISYLFLPFYHGKQWQKLGGSGLLILAIATLNMILLAGEALPLGQYWLASATGGMMLVPSCYLIWSYIFERAWVAISIALIHHKISFRSRHIMWYGLLFILNILIQVGLPAEFRRFAPFCLAIPIILLAFRYGWQGALLGTLLNSIALIAISSGYAQQSSEINLETTDLLLSLMAQTLTGICLGLGVQRQRELNQDLRAELTRNHNLARQLIKTEESVRRSIARELHDEIGQNITAIRTQSNIIQRVQKSGPAYTCANMIESLSLNVYDTTKYLLAQLRPKTLDDLGLKEAILQLIRDMEFARLGIQVNVYWHCAPQTRPFSQLNDVTQVTLYRITQEALNNALKYAKAHQIIIHIHLDPHQIQISIQDDGKGFVPCSNQNEGFGLQGMRERVQALGGQLTLRSDPIEQHPNHHGTQLCVQLPII